MSGTRNPLAAGGVFEPDPGNALAAPPSLADAWDANRTNMRDTWTAAKDPQFWMDAADQYRSAMLMGSVAPKLKGLGLDAAGMKVLRDMTPGFRAYHGTPHSFDRFSSDKIGTGEGAQAYGHGLYFADSEGVARSYRDALSPRGGRENVVPDADLIAKHQPQWEAFMKQREAAYRSGGDTSAIDAQMDAMHSRMVDETIARNPDVIKPGGHMYEVNVASDPAHFLDWDKPLSEQTPHVQQAISKLPIDAAAGRPITYGEMKPHIEAMRGVLSGTPFGNIAERVLDPVAKGFDLDALRTYLGPEKAAAFDQARSAYAKTVELRGKEIHDLLADKYDDFSGNQPTAAEHLQAAGIPGIRYLDGSSRAGGEGTRNSVIFDPETIKILRKYGLAGLMAGGGAAAGVNSGNPD